MKSVGAFFLGLLGLTCAAAADFPPVRLERINERVVALLGPTEVPNRANGGYMKNNLAIIGEAGVILVDAGSHKDVAEHILKALRTVTENPSRTCWSRTTTSTTTWA